MQKQCFVAVVAVLLGGAAVAKPKIAPLSASEAKLAKCELHGTRLQSGTAPILYGRRAPVVPRETTARAFPHAQSHVYGGCIVSKDSPALQAVKFCSGCRATEKRWLAAHHKRLPTR